MHETPTKLVKRQAEAIGIPLRIFSTNFDLSYTNCIKKEIEFFRSKNIDTSIFGDIFLTELRKYRESKCNEVGFNALFPLWELSPVEIMNNFVSLGFKAVIVSIDESKLSKNMLGRIIDSSFIEAYPKNSDICGENGEYHSFVYDGPIFHHPVKYKISEPIITIGNNSHLLLE